MKYLIRSVKYFLYFAILFGILVSIMFYTSTRPEGSTVFDLFKADSGYQIFLFFIVFSGIYPLLGFAKKQIYVNNLPDKKNEVIELFKNANFIVIDQTPTSITFRHKNKLLRLTRMFEDTIIVDFSGNPVIVDGMRKDVFRFSRGIEYICQKDSE